MKTIIALLIALGSLSTFAQSQEVECKIKNQLTDVVPHSWAVYGEHSYHLKYEVKAEVGDEIILKTAPTTDLTLEYGSETKEVKSTYEANLKLMAFKERLLEIGCTSFIVETGSRFNKQLNVLEIFQN